MIGVAIYPLQTPPTAKTALIDPWQLASPCSTLLLILVLIIIVVIVVIVVALVRSVHRRGRCRLLRLPLRPRTLARRVLLRALDRAAVALEAVVAASDLFGADGVGDVVVAVEGGEVGGGVAVVVPEVELGPEAEEELGDLKVALFSSPVESGPPVAAARVVQFAPCSISNRTTLM